MPGESPKQKLAFFLVTNYGAKYYPELEKNNEVGMKTPHTSTDSGSSFGYVSKKCPECMEYMPLNVDVCPSCELRVGKINKHGMATRKTDWKAYATAIAAWLAFCLYIWWAFIREP
jgi:hypothetical protein